MGKVRKAGAGPLDKTGLAGQHAAVPSISSSFSKRSGKNRGRAGAIESGWWSVPFLSLTS